MTEQITVPKQTWDAVVEALEHELLLIGAGNFISDAAKERLQALTAANAVSHLNPETTPLPEGGAITSESAANAVSEQAQGESSEHQYAKHLCIEMARKHYPEAAQFKPQDDLLGILTQIDNMAAGLVRPQATEPACKTCKHFTQGKNPLVGTYEMQCFECCNYYASKWEERGAHHGK